MYYRITEAHTWSMKLTRAGFFDGEHVSSQKLWRHTLSEATQLRHRREPTQRRTAVLTAVSQLAEARRL